MKLLQRIGWFLTYFQIVVLIPFGTCTQGDDDAWAASILYAVVPGFRKWYFGSFEPELWHRFWAPIVTVLGLACVVLSFKYFMNYLKDHRTKRLPWLRH